MPFATQTPRAFNRQNIEALNTNQSGVYGIFKQGVWVYVGKGDIRQRLLDHLNGDNPCILRQIPTHWVAEVIPNQTPMNNRERELILELNPACNMRVG